MMDFYNDSRREHVLIGVLIGVVLAVATYMITVAVANAG